MHPYLPALSSTPRRFPLLVVPDHKNIHTQTFEEEYDDFRGLITIYINNGTKRSLYCPVLKQTLQFQLELPPQFHSTHRFCGSSHGWLIASTVDDQEILHVSLFNPFSGNIYNNVIFNLPPITQELVELPYLREEYEQCKNILEIYHNQYVHKAVLSCDPSSNPDDYIIIVIYGGQGRLALIRPATDTTWTYLDSYKMPISDVIYYKGKVFAVDWLGVVFCCEAIDGISGNVSSNWTVRVVSGVQSMFSQTAKKYLVESVDGNLLQVLMSFDYDETEPCYSAVVSVKEIQVFKLMKDANDLDCDNSDSDQWVQINCIGDCALFVGNNESTSVLASDIGGCSSNSVYFTPDESEHTTPMSDPYGYRRMGVYHLEDGSIDLINYNTSAMSSQTPIWITTVTDELTW